ncbi:hypothetical protein DXA98_03220 [Lachnospiraceae bacterium OF09-6]|nr:hypothetical protein DXA98_03220 [Lachnospiraceae bacterium OF09-6]
MKRGFILAAVIGAGCILTGCSSFSPEVTGVSVSKNGTVIEVVRENFDASYYSEEELKNTVESEITDYNSSHTDKAVKKKSLKIKDGEADEDGI